MRTRTAISTALTVATAVIATTATTAVADSPIPGTDQPTRQYQGEHTNPATGQREGATITEYPDVTRRSTGGTVRPAAGTGGLLLRTSYGTPTGSGMYENASAQFVACGTGGLIKVRQNPTPGVVDGYGPSYEGWVTRSAAIGDIPC